MNQIILKVKAIDWSYGNISYVWILLDGGSCNIDWGDNHKSSIRVPPYSKEPVWLGDSHAYPRSCMASADEHNIIISSANDNTPLSEKSLEIIRRIITGNGGVIEYDDTE